jgi:hypothetical protein
VNRERHFRTVSTESPSSAATPEFPSAESAQASTIPTLGLLTRDGPKGLADTLHLHATDEPGEWWIDLNHGGTVSPVHAGTDTAGDDDRPVLAVQPSGAG